MARKAALSFLLNRCFRLNLSLKDYKVRKSTRQNINEHTAFNEKELKELFDTAEPFPEMNALVHLLYDMAARLQDVVGLNFGQILLLEP